MFSYITPELNFYVEDGEIVRDTNNDLWEGKDPYLKFRCTNDITHDLNTAPSIVEYLHIQNTWESDISREFYDKIFPDL